jgi:lipoate-protein ligase A
VGVAAPRGEEEEHGVRSAIIVRSGRMPPAANMEADESILRSAPPSPVLRLYGWSPPGLSLGRFQSDAEAATAIAAFPKGVAAVRRPTGGGAIYHDDEVTYALVMSLADPVIEGAGLGESYRRLDAPVISALAAEGVAARHRGAVRSPKSRRAEPFFCFDRESPLDLVAELPARDRSLRKIAGSAQRRTRTHLLQHGSVLLSGHEAIAGAAGVNDFRAAKGEAKTTFDGLAHALEAAFARVLSLRFLPPLSPGVLAEL